MVNRMSVRNECLLGCFKILIFPDDFRVEEFYVAPSAKNGNEDVGSEVYASSGKYIDPVSDSHQKNQ